MSDEDIHIYDVIIIGAGPAGLAVAARLCESTPSALFTDSEHQRYHWMKASSARQTSKRMKVSRRSNTVQDRLLRGPSFPGGKDIDMAVLDANGDQWMSAWDKKFEDLKISHLRSPMFFHPDPRDRDGLLEFAYKEGREGELREIKGVVGKALSKHQRKQKMKNSGKRQQETSYLDERDRPDYFRPSQSLFKNYCSHIASRYNISSIVQKTTVHTITYDSHSSSTSKIFTLQTSTGLKHARIVVLAIGAALIPTLPPDCPFCSLESSGSVTHAFQPLLPQPKPSPKTKTTSLPPHIQQRLASKKPVHIAVVGGGLTSAQITATCISASVTKVFHIMRGPLKTKHFDLGLEWVGKYKNFHFAQFWSADSDEERAEMIKEARNGGSINPEYRKILLKHVEDKRVEICENTKITSASWDNERNKWEIETQPQIEGLKGVGIDHVIYATGIATDFKNVEMVRELREKKHIDVIGGLPCLTNELMWGEDVPAFITGRLAGLRVGPAAANLEGARQGAERIAWKVGELLGKIEGKRRDSGYGSEEWEWEGEVDGRRLGLGMGNQFEVLGG